jgi:hypothetical protein
MVHDANELVEEASYLITIIIIPDLLRPDETSIGSLENVCLTFTPVVSH